MALKEMTTQDHLEAQALADKLDIPLGHYIQPFLYYYKGPHLAEANAMLERMGNRAITENPICSGTASGEHWGAWWLGYSCPTCDSPGKQIGDK